MKYAMKKYQKIAKDNSIKFIIDNLNPDYALDSLYKIILASNPLQ